MRPPFPALLVLPLLVQPLWAETCEHVTIPEAVAALYRDMAESPDGQVLDQLLVRDLDGDGANDMLAVQRLRTEGGAGDAARLLYRAGVAEGVCSPAFDINLDAGAGEISVEAQQVLGNEADRRPPDLVVRFRQNATTATESSIDVTTKPATRHYRYDAESFGYVEVRP